MNAKTEAATRAYIGELEVALIWADRVLNVFLQPEEALYTTWQNLQTHVRKKQELYTQALQEEFL